MIDWRNESEKEEEERSPENFHTDKHSKPIRRSERVNQMQEVQLNSGRSDGVRWEKRGFAVIRVIRVNDLGAALTEPET